LLHTQHLFLRSLLTIDKSYLISNSIYIIEK